MPELASLLAAAWLPLPVVAFGLSEAWRRTAWWLTLALAFLLVAGVALWGTTPALVAADYGRGVALPLVALRGPLEVAVSGARPLHARMLLTFRDLLPAEGGDWRTALVLVWRGSLASGASLALAAALWRALPGTTPAETAKVKGAPAPALVTPAVRVPWRVHPLAWCRKRYLPTRHAKGKATIGYGATSGLAVAIPLGDLTRHGIVVGNSGSGKTTLLTHVLDASLASNTSVVMLDCKGDPDVRAYFEARGGLVWSVSGEGMTHPVDPHTTTHRTTQAASQRVRWDAVSGDRTLFADKLTAAEMEHSTATYYPVIMRRYLQLVATVQDAQHGQGAPRDPHEVVGLLHPAALKQAAQTVKDAPGMAAVLTTLEHDFGDDEHTEKALLGFRHRYSTLLEGVAGGGLGVGVGTLVLEQAVRERRPVLFSLAVEAYQDTGRKIGTWALLEMQRVATALRGDQWARRGGRCLLVLDEFGQLGRETSRVVTLLEMARSAGIGVLLATQGITSLRDLGEDAREGKALVGTILNNCNTKAVLKLGSDADREWWVSYFGEESVTDPATGKATKRPLVSAEELAALKQGQAVLHRDGELVRVVVPRPRPLPTLAPLGEPPLAAPAPQPVPLSIDSTDHPPLDVDEQGAEGLAAGDQPAPAARDQRPPLATPRGRARFLPGGTSE